MDTKTKTRSIFSGTGGLISALAGLVTVILGLLAIGSQVGWFDGDKSKNPDTEVITGEGAQTESGAAGTGSGSQSATSAPTFSVAPTEIDFKLVTDPEAEVRVDNIGSTPLSVQRPTVTGPDAAAFQAASGDCSGAKVAPDSSCTVKVKFVGSKAAAAEATLLVPVANSDAPARVSLSFSIL